MVERDLAKVEVAGSSPVIRSINGPVVQLVRTLACHARGHGFESRSGRSVEVKTRRIYASVAQLVEQGIENSRVVGSIPTGGMMGLIAESESDWHHATRLLRNLQSNQTVKTVCGFSSFGRAQPCQG